MIVKSDYAGFRLVPSSVVPIVRGAFMSQGIDGSMISDSGDVEPQALIALLFDTIEVRTRLTPSLVIDLKRAPVEGGDRLLKEIIQPELIFRGNAGEFKLNPYGEPTGISPEVGKWGWIAGLGIGGLLLAMILLGAKGARLARR